MKALKDMDLYKGIILVSVLLLPAIGWWAWSLDKQIEATKAAITEATRPGGLLEQIGALQQKAEIVVANRTLTGDATSMPSVYFDSQIRAVAPGKISGDDFTIGPPTPSGARIGRQQLTDHDVKVTWGKSGRDKPVSMEFLFAMLFNCESGARTGITDASKIQSIWKLRSLSIQNAAFAQVGSAKRTPKEAQTEDQWLITDLVFARREPKKEGKGE
ncbi:MAG: hypothetical protein IPK26_23465 [Planctomycetes bacterium]|nr:hypothetical protein [Planctomycetota bacterium]